MKQSENAGRVFLKWLAEQNIRLHFIASSTLLRAIQTAHHMFVAPCQDGGPGCDVLVGNLTVSPLPYVAERTASEEPLQADNLPASLSAQQEVLRKLYSRDIMDDRFVLHWPRLAQQYQKFQAFLALVLVPWLSPLPPGPAKGAREVVEDAVPIEFDPLVLQWPGGGYRVGRSFTRATYELTEGPELNVALVGHGAMMAEDCLEGGASPLNNEVLEKLFILDLPDPRGPLSLTELRELEGRCRVVMTAPALALDLTTADVKTCTPGFDVAHFLHLSAASSGDTACVAE
ncbi:unnamed protein product, partial [Symbiodinium natans]